MNFYFGNYKEAVNNIWHTHTACKLTGELELKYPMEIIGISTPMRYKYRIIQFCALPVIRYSGGFPN